MGVQRTLPTLVGTVSAAVLLTALLGQAQAPAAPAPPPGAGGGQAPSATNAALWTAFDADKDNSVTQAEMKTAFDKWYDAADTAKSGSISTEQLGTVLSGVRRPRQPADDRSDAVSGRRHQDDGGAARNRPGQAGQAAEDSGAR